MPDARLEELPFRPQCFGELNRDHKWYAFYQDKVVCGYAAVGSLPGLQAQIHFEMCRPQPSYVKTAIRLFHDVFVPELKHQGYVSILATNYYKGKKSESWVNFIKRFGFDEPQVILVSSMEI